MTRSLLIARREVYAYLRSPLGAAIIAATLLVDGLWFYWFGLSQQKMSFDVLAEFFETASGTTMIASIILSMRLLAEERQTGTITLLNTAPLRDAEIVFGKFLAAFGVIVVMTALTLYMPLIVKVHGKISVGHIVVGYLGILLLGGAATSIGLFASALARSQVVAAIVGAVLLGVLILQWMVSRVVEPPLNEFLASLALHHQNFMPFKQGILDLKRVVYYLVLTFFFLLAATKILEARRWR
jgi:ABC-2 type transport system permease protein